MNVRFLHLFTVLIDGNIFCSLGNSSLNCCLPGNLISHIFRENEICRDTEWERYFSYKNIEVPEIYSGPHLTFPLTVEQAVGLVEAFRNKKVGAKEQQSSFNNNGTLQ